MKSFFESEQIVCFGDIHGQLEQLKDLIEKVDFYLAEELELYHYVFLGDYVDRGEKVKETLDFLIKLKHERKGRVYFLMGYFNKI